MLPAISLATDYKALEKKLESEESSHQSNDGSQQPGEGKGKKQSQAESIYQEDNSGGITQRQDNFQQQQKATNKSSKSDSKSESIFEENE